MAIDLVPTSFWRFPVSRSVWDDDEDISMMSTPSGISISEDETHVYVEVALPGVDPKDVDITFDKGTLWVKGEAKIEEKKKKFYRKATSSFSYRIAVPGEIDGLVEPEASAKHGVMTVTFAKSKSTLPKKISVKA